MNRAPKKLLESLPEFSVTLKHIQIRREKGLITATLDPTGKGTSYKYDATESLVYVVATILESVGYDMETAFSHARSSVSENFISSMINKDFVWLVDVNGGEVSFTKEAQFSSSVPPEYNIAPDSYNVLSPKAGIYLILMKDDYAEMERLAGGNIYSIAYRSISAILIDGCKRLKLSTEEIEGLNSACRRNNHIMNVGSHNFEKYDFG